MDFEPIGYIKEKYNVNPTTIEYWRDKNKIRYVKNGKFYKYCIDDIIKILEDKKEKKQPKGIKCLICNQVTKFNSWRSFSRYHLLKIHDIDQKQYYDEYIINDINERFCKTCSKEKKFISLTKGYSDFCSDNKCRNNDKNLKEKIKLTKLEKYGDKNYTNREKHRKTCMENYGVEHYTNREKHRKTCMENYGVENPMQNIDISKKHFDIKAKNKIEFYKNKLNDQEIEILSLDSQKLKIKCNKCNKKTEINTKLVYTRLKYGITICTNCFPICDIKIISFGENEIAKFIEEETNLTVKRNVRNLISKEIDIFIPEANLAIEYNGIYWHSDKKKSKTYHLEKTEECESKGIKLIHIFEDEWKTKKSLIKNKIINLLGLIENRIFARKCEIIESVNINDQIEFYQNNHQQGYVKNIKTLGLKYNNKYVAMMSFSSNRNKEKYDVELVRYASEKSSNVVGGFSKLLSKFSKSNPNKTIVTYADRCWSSGNLYEKTGFHLDGISPPSYFYYNPSIGMREHRFNYRKDRLKEMGFDIENKTEFEIIDFETDLIRVYNCGYKRFIFKT